jgi:recombination protein RecA
MKTKVKKPRITLDGQSVKGIINQLNAKYGAGTAIGGDISVTPEFIATGVAALDFATGGGIPKNRITEINGPYSSLKSTISLMTAASFLREHKDNIVIYVDLERTYEPNYAKQLGVATDRLVLVLPDSGEQAIDATQDVLELNRPTLIIFDSIAAATPTAEIESSMDQGFVGAQARLINRAMRVITSRLKRSSYDKSFPTTTVIAINQIRHKVGTVYGDPETTPGGLGKDFAYSLIIRLRSSPSDRIVEKIERNGLDRQIRVGQNVKFRVLKNKCASSQFEEGSFIYYVKDFKNHKRFSFNNEEVVAKYAIYYGVVERVEKSAKSDQLGYSHLALKGVYKDASSLAVALSKQPKALESIFIETRDALMVEESEIVMPDDSENEDTE